MVSYLNLMVLSNFVVLIIHSRITISHHLIENDSFPIVMLWRECNRKWGDETNPEALHSGISTINPPSNECINATCVSYGDQYEFHSIFSDCLTKVFSIKVRLVIYLFAWLLPNGFTDLEMVTSFQKKTLLRGHAFIFYILWLLCCDRSVVML